MYMYIQYHVYYAHIGRVAIQLSDMPNGQDDDKWHHLITKTSRTAQGSLRLVANFKVSYNNNYYCLCMWLRL